MFCNCVFIKGSLVAGKDSVGIRGGVWEAWGSGVERERGEAIVNDIFL